MFLVAYIMSFIVAGGIEMLKDIVMLTLELAIKQ